MWERLNNRSKELLQFFVMRVGVYWATILAIFLIALVVVVVVMIVLHLAFGMRWADWTGLGEYTGSLTKDQRGKTLWDWLGLLIIPVVLALAALFFNRQERQNELRIAEIRKESDLKTEEARNQEVVLQNYLDKMSELILEKGLIEVKHVLDKQKQNSQLTSETNGVKDDILSDAQRAVCDMAQIRTVTTLRQLNSTRRNIVLDFLRAANLNYFILEHASLDHADLSKSVWLNFNLSGANLIEANLAGALLFITDLHGANLSEANLTNAILAGANLAEATLINANLTGAALIKANLRGANLKRADLTEAVLGDPSVASADLSEADLSGSNLTGAWITEEQLASVKSLAGATLPDGSKIPDETNQP